VRRHLAAIPFGFSYVEPPLADPWLPEGFSEGGLDIVSATGADGEALTVSWHDNPLLPKGYSVERALLRVDPPGGATLRSLTLVFRTRLPNRLVEGWSDTGWLLDLWHPAIANYSAGHWDLDVHRPRPGLYSARVATAAPGWVATGRGEAVWLDAGAEFDVAPVDHPEKSLPLAFVPAGLRIDATDPAPNVAFLAQPDGQRLALLTHRLASNWFSHFERELGLPAPSPGLVVVQGDLPPGETVTLGNLIVVSGVFAHNPALLDRLYADALARALGRVWFGETVWSDGEREAWLPLGFSGYLALRFFEARYGWDARMHTVADWLSPRYREHHYEAPARDLIHAQEDAPLLIPFTGHPAERTALTVLHRKAPLVLRMLEFAVGTRNFGAALSDFFQRNRHREVDHDAWQAAVGSAAGESMDWFFNQWFTHAAVLDYAVGEWQDEPLPDGRWRLTVSVLRTVEGVMPVDVEAVAEGGHVERRRIEGRLSVEKVEFVLPGKPVSITLDPEERLLEENRRNNHTDTLFRVRPFFDWGKQREVLVSLVGRVGGDAVDGNYAGLGANVVLDEDNEVRAIPIYGERTGMTNFEVTWARQRFLHPRLSLTLQAQQLGGASAGAAAVGYRYFMPDRASMNTSIAVRAEQVQSIAPTKGERNRSQVAGVSNNLGFTHSAGFQWDYYWASDASLTVERGQPALGSRFDYNVTNLRLSQSLEISPRHRFRFEFVGTAASAETPLQKQPLLGDPLVLRGYPRDFELVYENIAALRLDYRWTFSRQVWGAAVQVRRTIAILFTDAGLGWDAGDSPGRAQRRQDAGVGLEFHLNAAGLVEFPARIEIAWPYNDRQYKRPKVVIFQALSFF
jgi:hypothetical protein